MGRYGVDYISVREAAEVLTANGEAVTVERVRATLGSGSFTTLGRHLRTWRRTQDPATVSDGALPDLINDAAQTVWNNLSRAAEQRVAEAQTAAQTAVVAMEERLTEDLAAARNEQKQNERQHKEAERHYQARLQEAQGRAAELQISLQRSQEACQAADLRAEQSVAAQQQLTQRLQEAQLQLQREREAQSTLEARTGALEANQKVVANEHRDTLIEMRAQHDTERLLWSQQERARADEAEAQQLALRTLEKQASHQETVASALHELQAQQAQSERNSRKEGLAQRAEASKDLAAQLERMGAHWTAKQQEAWAQSLESLVAKGRDSVAEHMGHLMFSIKSELANQLSETKPQNC